MDCQDSSPFPRAIPGELVELIFQQLDIKSDQPTIRAIRATNRRLHHHAHDYLYIAINHPDQQSEPTRPGRTLQRWAWKVAQRPDLAWQIKELHVHGDALIHLPDMEALEKIPPTKTWSTALERCSLPPDLRDEIFSHMLQDTPRAHLVFLLALCTYLKVLFILSTLARLDLIRRILLGGLDSGAAISPVVAGVPPKLCAQSIRSLHLVRRSRQCNMMVDEVLPLLNLPNLQKLWIDQLGNHYAYSEDLPPLEEGRNSANGIELVADHCKLTGIGLSRYLSACAVPKSLAVRWVEPPFGRPDFTLRLIIDAIRNYGSKLEHIHLDVLEMEPRSSGSVADGSIPPHCFEELHHLRSLAIPMWVFDGFLDDPARILPASLEEIFLLGVGKDMRDIDDDEFWDTLESDLESEQEDQIVDQGSESEGERDQQEEYLGDLIDSEGSVESSDDSTDIGKTEVVDGIVQALENSQVRLPLLKKVVRVPWKYYIKYDRRLYHRRRCVDYETVGGFPFQNIGGHGKDITRYS